MTGTLLPPQHRAVQAVRRVGMRVARAATDGYGGGYQEHLKHMEWEFAVVSHAVGTLWSHCGHAVGTLWPCCVRGMPRPMGLGTCPESGEAPARRPQVNSPQVNAFVVPGGKVVVYTGEGGTV